MDGEKITTPGTSYLARLGALSALLCGVTAPLGVVLVVVDPAPHNLIALLVCVGVACAGAAVARSN